MPIEDIFGEIKKTKKYGNLSESLIIRVINEEYGKYKKDKDRIKAVKNKLHQIFGAYTQEDAFSKIFSLLDGNSGEIMEPTKIGAFVLEQHVSTAERAPYYREFYNFIANNVPTTSLFSILDIGCGLNPFSIIYCPKPISKYFALDIDKRISELNNRFFSLLGIPETAGEIDIISEIPTSEVDVALLLKLLPVIDNQKKGRAIEVLLSLNAKVCIVSFPIKTLTGKNVGMEENYTRRFTELVNDHFQIVERTVIGNELYFAIMKRG